jgi:hypothetical protein
MRFHVPNNEMDKYFDDKEKAREAAGKTEDDEDDQDADITASKLFNDKIVAKANKG